MRRCPLLTVVVGLGIWTLSVGTAMAQELVNVTVAGPTQPGFVVNNCPPQPPGFSATFPEFVLARTGDVTDGLTVSIAWSGDFDTTVSPTSVTFAPGSSTAPVTAMFTPTPDATGHLTLSVTSAGGYQVGDPSTVTTSVYRVDALCLAPPPEPIPSPPLFTG